MNPERLPYAAIVDLESVVKMVAKESKGRVLILYDPQKGWWAGDEIDEAVEDAKSGAMIVKGRTYVDWRRDNIAEALSAVAAARFIPGNAVTKLFRRAPPAPPQAEAVAGKTEAGTAAKQASAPSPKAAPAAGKQVVTKAQAAPKR